MRRLVAIAAGLAGLAAMAQGASGVRCLDDDCDTFVRSRASVAAPNYTCDLSEPACNAGNNNLAHPEDFANGAWSTYGSGAAAPTVSAATTATIDGQTVTCNRVQWPAVAAGQESSLYQRLAGDIGKKVSTTKSLYLRSHAGAAMPTGDLPLANAQAGADGQGYQMCSFTSAFSRCETTYVSCPTCGFNFFWLGYVAAQSGTSAALDLDICGPKDELGAGGATAFQCPSPLQVAGVPAHSGYVEGNATADWGITKRDGAALVRVADGTFVLFGGWSSSALAEWSEDGGSNVTTNQVYKSTNDGTTWTAVLAHADDPPQTGGSARWRRRHSHCGFTATVGGTEYIYVIGGDGFDSYYGVGDGTSPYPADVWRAAAATYGAAGTWVRMTAAAEWGATGIDADGGARSRVLHSCWADDSGNLYVAGGQSSLVNTTALHDVWKSTNGGTSWTSLGNAAWPARGTIASPLPRFGGKTWLVGGEVYDNNAGDRIYYNDSWSFNDSTWTLAQPDAGFSPSGYHNLVAWNGRLWKLKGYPNTNTAQVYSSATGACWRHERAVAGSPEHAASVAISSDGGYLVITGSSTSTAVTTIHAP